MLNIKNSEVAKNSALLQAYSNAAAEAGIAVKETQQVGNSGYQLGGVFTPTGIEVVTTEINGNKSVYFGITTKEGTTLSLKNLMGVTSLSGYKFEGTANSVSRDASGEPVESTSTAEILADLPKDPAKLNSQLLTFNTTDLYQVVVNLEKDVNEKPENQTFFGKKLQYCGRALKQVIAKRDSKPGNFDTWKAGDARVISTQLWKLL